MITGGSVRRAVTKTSGNIDILSEGKLFLIQVWPERTSTAGKEVNLCVICIR